MNSNFSNKISIVIPVLNEHKFLLLIIKKLIFEISSRFKFYEIIIIDDSNNYLASKRILNNFKNVFFFKNIKKGLLNSIKYGVSKTNSDNIVVMDGDLSHDLKMLDLIKKKYLQYDLINFSRFIKKGTDKRTYKKSGPLKYYSYFINKILIFLITPKLTDYTCGYFFFKKKKINNSFFLGDYGEYSIFFLYNCIKKKFKFKEYPCYFYDRKAGQSKTGLTNFKIIIKGIKYIKIAIVILLSKNKLLIN